MFRIEVASLPDREELVSELWWHNDQVAELTREEHWILRIFDAPGASWEFDLDSLIQALAEMKSVLE